MTNVVNQVSYLRTSRSFPKDINELTEELNKSYIDTANSVNTRTIGIYPTNRPAITGETFFIQNNQKQQGLRQVYTFTTTAAIPHGIIFTQIDQFSRCYGEYTDGTNWYGLVSGSSVAIAGQISFYLTPTNITFLMGGGAPFVTRGIVTLEWISVS